MCLFGLFTLLTFSLRWIRSPAGLGRAARVVSTDDRTARPPQFLGVEIPLLLHSHPRALLGLFESVIAPIEVASLSEHHVVHGGWPASDRTAAIASAFNVILLKT